MNRPDPRLTALRRRVLELLQGHARRQRLAAAGQWWRRLIQPN
jgi:hypothetical protein